MVSVSKGSEGELGLGIRSCLSSLAVFSLFEGQNILPSLNQKMLR